jgi:hypothetical protein
VQDYSYCSFLLLAALTTVKLAHEVMGTSGGFENDCFSASSLFGERYDDVSAELTSSAAAVGIAIEQRER